MFSFNIFSLFIYFILAYVKYYCNIIILKLYYSSVINGAVYVTIKEYAEKYKIEKKNCLSH